MATKKPMKKPVKRVRRFQEGGEAALEAALKAEGLAASNRDAPKGFFESLRRFGQGNIDQAGSEAYNLYGAGRGRMERDAKSEADANRMVDEARAAKGISNYQQSVDQDEMDRGADMRNYEMMQRGRAEGERDEKRMAPSLAQTQNAAILAAKPSRTASGKTTGDFTRLDRKALLPSGPNVKFAPGGVGKRRAASAEDMAAASAAPAAAPRNGASAIPKATAPAGVSDGERLPEVTGMSNLEKLMAGTGIAGGLAGLAGLGLKARNSYRAAQAARMGARKRADLKEQAIDQINQVRKTDGRPSLDTGAPIKSRSDLKQKTIDEINQNRKADGRPPLADNAMKRGGKVKKMAHGGSVKSSTASSRGDGIALRGKTRGKIY